MSHNVQVILNPHAGNAGDRAVIEAALTVWRNHGWRVALHPTHGPGHAIVLAQQAVSAGADLVVAAGGDGTVNEVVNGLANTQTALAVLPVGTGNVWIRETGLPLQPVEAALRLLEGQPYALDLGVAGDRYFLLMAGIGFDADVIRYLDPAAKRRLGMVAYVTHAIARARQVRGTPVRLVLDGRPVKGRVLQVVVGNSRLYGGFLQIAHQASPIDGLLDVVVIKGGDMRVAPLHLLSILLRRYHFNPDLDYYRARELTLTAGSPLEVQVDGDALCRTPVTFRVVPRALQAWLPADAYQRLVGPPPVMSGLDAAWRRLRSRFAPRTTP